MVIVTTVSTTMNINVTIDVHVGVAINVGSTIEITALINVDSRTTSNFPSHYILRQHPAGSDD